MSNVYLALKRSVGLVLLLFYQAAFTQPVINSFSPTSGPVGTIVTITGTGFNPMADSNIVYFGSVRATVQTASANSITVAVPAGAKYAPITVTTNGLTAYSRLSFDVTFANGDTPFDTTSFAPQEALTGLGNPRNVVCADFDRDGKSDIFVTNQSLNTGTIYRNISASGAAIYFATPKNIALGNSPFCIATGDLNGDGLLDVAVTNMGAGQAATVSVLRNTSSLYNIQFTTTSYSTGDGTIGVAIADVDADGKPDLVTTSSNSGIISVFRNTTPWFGSITFAPKVDFSTFDRADEVAIGDLDHDGKPELVTANFLGSISVWQNLSSPGNIVLNKINYPAGSNPTGIAIADMNGDGKSDIVLSHYGSAYLSVFRNRSTTGSISFDTKRDFTTDKESRGISIGDLNGDGKPDVAVVSDSSDVLTLLQNASVGDTIILNNRYDIPVGAGPTGVAIGDLNGDGKVDIAATNSYSSVSIFRNLQNDPLPVITSFTPTSAKRGDTVSIFGSGFTGATTVRFGGIWAQIVNSSDTAIRAIVDTGATGNVSVTTPFGTAYKAGFTFISDTTSLPDTTAPVITSFTPTSGKKGTVVTIFGSHLTGVFAVRFGGVLADSIRVVSDTVMQAVVDTGATGNVTIFKGLRSATKAGFTFIKDTTSIPDTTTPAISWFYPTSGRKGTFVTIHGSNFRSANAVRFGGVLADSIYYKNDTVIVVTVDTGATGNVSVATLYGTASKPGFTFIRDSIPDTTAPAIKSFVPTSARKGAFITILGTGFRRASAVQFGGVRADSVLFKNDTVIIAVVGNGATGNVSVTNPYGTGSKAGFTFISDTTAPVITSFTPTSAPKGADVVIYGSNFAGVTAVRFGGVRADTILYVTNTMIRARVGTGASGSVTVTTPHGIAAKPGFTFIPDTTAPVITSFTPTSAQKGADVVIYGSSFAGVTAVRFGGVLADTILYVTNTMIRARVGTGASGSVTVTTPYGIASKPGFTFIGDTTNIPDTTAPVITSFTPTSGQQGTFVYIIGKYFTGTTQVQFGGVPSDSVVVLSDTVIQAMVDTGATGNVCVFTPFGFACKSGFTFIADTTITDTLIVNARTGINNGNAITVAKPFTLYPNPASQYVIWQQPVTNHSTRLQLIDITGRVVRNMVVGSNVSQTTIQIGGLHTGVYKLVWSDGKKKLTRTLLVQ
jgi:hypothetical protein